METIGSHVVCLMSQYEWGSSPRTELIRSCNCRSDLPFQGLTMLHGRREKCQHRTHLVATFQCVFPLESGSTASQVFLVVVFIFFCQLLRRFFQFTEELKENVRATYSLTHSSKPLVTPGKGLHATQRSGSHLPAKVSRSNYRWQNQSSFSEKRHIRAERKLKGLSIWFLLLFT